MAAHPPTGFSLSTPVFDRRRDHSPAPSPTRDRRKNMTFADSTWAVSPSVTLKAFTEGISPPGGTDEQDLLRGISNASRAEKELGARVALATKKLKTWCAELEHWKWSGSFETPREKESDIQEKSTDHCINDGPTGMPSGYEFVDETEHWGSLPPAQIQAYGKRIDQIKEELDALNMDELKGHILDMHPADRSRPSATFAGKRTQPVLLDDFSFVVTQTMLQALPYLSMLNQLTGVWSVRLAVLREVPVFLFNLDGGKTAMELGWEALELPDESEQSAKVLNHWKDAVRTIRDVLQTKITSLGQKLDGMLDALEGRDDVLPDHWIDDFETLEAEYTKWAVESQKRLFEVDMRMSRPPEKLTRPTSARGADQPFRLSGSHFARNGLLSAGNTIDFLEFQGGTARPAKSSDNVADLTQSVPSLGLPFSPISSSGLTDRGHQRTRSSSEPHVYLPQFSEPRIGRVGKGKGPLIEVTDHLVMSGLEEEYHSEPEQSLNSEKEAVHSGEPDPAGLKRASIASIESFTPPQVSSINVRRNSSSSSTSQQPAIDGLEYEGHDTSSVSIDQQIAGLKTPDPRYYQDDVSPVPSLESSPARSFDDSPSLRSVPERPLTKARRPPLNSAMPKRRAVNDKGRATPAQDHPGATEDSAVFDSPDFPATLSAGLDIPRRRNARRISSATEDLEKQIRRIITSVHAPIRLTSGFDTETTPMEYRTSRKFSGSRPPSSLRVSRMPSSASLTMSPVKPEHELSSSARRSAMHGDSDIKLYHLMQPGKDKPIKLFVRRVGENGERVMVRVGGGWADLGEYLRQYAEHHGKRVVSASESKFEVLGVTQPSDTSTPRPTSSHSSDSTKGSRFGGTSAAPTSNGSTPARSPAKSITAMSRPGSAMATSTPYGKEEALDLPNSGASQRSWQGDEVGLAGPNTKKLELSGEKLEWIEGMMNQAKKLGHKSSGTRKVFLKH